MIKNGIISLIKDKEPLEMHFNMLPGKFITEVIYPKWYKVVDGHVECLFDRSYISEMKESPDHLVIFTMTAHIQKMAYMAFCNLLGFRYEPNKNEIIKFWPITVNSVIPSLVTQTKNLTQHLEISEVKPSASGEPGRYTCLYRSWVNDTEVFGKCVVLVLPERQL